MSSRNYCFVVVIVSATVLMTHPFASLSGQDKQPVQDEKTSQDEQLSQELLKLKEEVTKAYNTGDLDLLLSFCHDDVIAVWQDGQVARGHQGIRDVVNELIKKDGIFASYSANPVVDYRKVLGDGNVVVSMGKLNDKYILTRPEGTEINLNSEWTVTLAKFEGRWLITSFHASADAIENEAITMQLDLARWSTGTIAGVSGLLLGLVVGIAFARRRKGPDRTKQEAPAA